jgi:hypothetical protein
MQKYPYIVKVGSLRDFLKKVPGIGVPDKIATVTLKSLGYTSSNDAPIPRILRFIGFIGEDGTPTDLYRQFRNKEKSGVVMAGSLKRAYAELFQTYPDAQNKDTEALRNFFSTSTEGGEAVLVNTVNTFKALCEFANFEAPSIETGTAPGETVSETITKVPITKVPAITGAAGLTINVNIELQLPATEDSTIYDKIFESLKKHILGR